MEFREVLGSRHSVRSYSDRDIDEDTLLHLLQDVNTAPSAGDLQAFQIVVVRSTERRRALAAAAFGQSFLAESPVILVFCADHLLSASKYGKRGSELYSVQDATIAAAYSELVATNMGLASAWVGAFDPEQVSSVINTPDQVTPIAMIALGYSDESPLPTPRRSLAELTRDESF